jgi:hypothetical protein
VSIVNNNNIQNDTPVTGFNITIGVGVNYEILNPAGTLATGTLTLPSGAVDQQFLSIISSQTITALTLSPAAGDSISGGITTMVPNVAYRYIYTLGTHTWAPTNAVQVFPQTAASEVVLGGFYPPTLPVLQPPNTQTGPYAQLASDYVLIFNAPFSVALTLLPAASYPGRPLWLKTIAAFTVVSATSNVGALKTGVIGTAILPATTGAFALLVSDGVDWQIMQSGT